MHDFGLTSEEFWDLNPTQFRALSDRYDKHEKQQDFRSALIVSTIMNLVRGENDPPVKATDIIKYGDEEEELSEEMSDEQIMTALMEAFPPKKERRRMAAQEARGG